MTMKTSEIIDLESLDDSKDIIEIPSLNQPCVFNDSSLPDQSNDFLTHVSIADNNNVKNNSGSEDTSCVPSESQSRANFLDLNLDAEEYLEAKFSASLDGYGPSYWEGNSNMEVFLLLDYVIHQDNISLGYKLTFSESHVHISNATAFESHGAFNIILTMDDLISIESQFYKISSTVIMKLRISCTSGIEEMKFILNDPNWSLTMKKITSLNSKYSDVWKIATEVDENRNENFSPGTTSYLPDIEKPFNNIAYPKGDPDAVYLSKRDFDLLQPNTYINDILIDFYVQYLKSKIPKDESSRYHFFNCFFFRKLADMDKDPSSASDGIAAFQRVRKWTRKVDLFEKDYIFIPVNFNLHWSLLVICHPGEVVNVNLNDNELETSPRVPCILHLDSIKGYHGGLKNLIQSYLNEEWKERQKNTCGEDLSSRFLNMRFLSVAVPQQRNNYDCGLFLLHYLELFLAEAPLNFNPLKLSKFSNFLNLDWFEPVEAYLKRIVMQRLISEIVKDNESHDISSPNDSTSGEVGCVERVDTNLGHCHVTNGESSTSYFDVESQTTLLTSSTVLKEPFKSGGSSGSDSLLPIKEVTDINENEISGSTTNVKGKSSQGVSSCAPDDSDDDVQIIEDLSIQNEVRSLKRKLPAIKGSTNVDLPIYSFMEIPLPSNSSHGQIIHNVEPDTCEEPATKKRRLLHFL